MLENGQNRPCIPETGTPKLWFARFLAAPASLLTAGQWACKPVAVSGAQNERLVEPGVVLAYFWVTISTSFSQYSCQLTALNMIAAGPAVLMT